MTTIRVYLGSRLSDKVTIRISDITDAVEIYNAVLDTGRTHAQAVEVVKLINAGEFKLGA